MYKFLKAITIEHNKEYCIEDTIFHIDGGSCHYVLEKRLLSEGYCIENINKNISQMISNGKLISSSREELKQHLENQFESWMNWDNWKLYDVHTWSDNDSLTWTWNIDHIIPQSRLKYSSLQDENFQKCWALKNLRPLSAKQNIKDGARKYE